MPDILAALKEKLPDVIIEENEPLAPFTAIRIGGPARYFLRARSLEMFKTAVLEARRQQLPFFLLGGGNGVLVSDKGFDGLVIKVEDRHWETDGELVRAGAGVPLVFLAREAAKAGNTGFEFMAAVPGTVGGALRSNAHVGERAIEQCIVRVRILDETGTDRWLTKEECGFGKHRSLFLERADVILEAEFFMEFGSAEDSENKVMNILQEKAAAPRPTLPAIRAFRDVVENGEIREASALVKEAGLHGQKVGAAGLSGEDPSFIVNAGAATADEVLQLMSMVKTTVRDQLGVQLEDAIELVGFSQR